MNGTDGVFIAARVDEGGCNVFAAHGIYFFVFAHDGKFIVANDLGKCIGLKEGLRKFVSSCFCP